MNLPQKSGEFSVRYEDLHSKATSRITKEFQEVAVRPVETSGQTRREIAEDLGIRLSTIRRWIDQRRDALMESPPPGRV